MSYCCWLSGNYDWSHFCYYCFYCYCYCCFYCYCSEKNNPSLKIINTHFNATVTIISQIAQHSYLQTINDVSVAFRHLFCTAIVTGQMQSSTHCLKHYYCFYEYFIHLVVHRHTLNSMVHTFLIFLSTLVKVSVSIFMCSINCLECGMLVRQNVVGMVLLSRGGFSIMIMSRIFSHLILQGSCGLMKGHQ